MKEEHHNLSELSDDVLKEASLYKNFSERSEIAQEVIGRKPSFIEKWALFVFCLLLLILLLCTWFIKYPDIIVGRAVLTGENAPKEIVSEQSGRLIGLFVKNNQTVKAGEIIAWLESNADTKEILDLSELLDMVTERRVTATPSLLSNLFKKPFKSLGELQSSYQIFVEEWQKYDDYIVNGFFKRKMEMLQDDIQALSSIEKRTVEQKRLMQKENELAKNTFDMNEILFKEKVISAEEYRRAQSILLDNDKSVSQSDLNIIIQQNQLRDKQKEINQLDHDIQQQQILFEQSLHTLKSKVDDWIKRFTLRAPGDGQIAFVLPLQQNQYINQNKLLGYVIPRESKYYVEVQLNQQNFGKVDTGMKVQLRFDAYPYQENGFIPGKLSYVSNVSIDSGFLGIVKLDKGLLTNLNKPIQYKNGLKAQALIITKDMRLLERLYYTIVKTTSFNK